MQTLVETSQKIGEVVKLIEDIASQTNLLALNATIVAAAIEEQSAASREISSSAEKASAGTMGMAANVREIDKGMGQVNHAAQEVTTVTEKLSDHSTKNVDALLKKMNVFMDELKKIV